MTEENFFEAVRLFCKRKPFRPYFIEFLTGDRLLISHPEAVIRLKKLAILTTTSSQHHLFDGSTVSRVVSPGRD
jgi:hypothetical protein